MDSNAVMVSNYGRCGLMRAGIARHIGKLFLTCFAALLLCGLLYGSAVGIDKKPESQKLFMQGVNRQAGKKIVSHPSKVSTSGIKVIENVRTVYDISAMTKVYFSTVSGASASSFVRLPEDKVKLPQKKAVHGRLAGGLSNERKQTRRTGLSGAGSKRASRVQGYCWFNRNFRVSIEQYIEIPCMLNVVPGMGDPNLFSRRLVMLKGKLVPKFAAYALELKPLEIEDVYTHKFYKVDSAVIYDVKTGSVNVADRINRELLKKAIMAGVRTGAEEAKTGYEQYARNKNSRVFTNGDQTVEEYHYPASYPLTRAVLGGVSAFVNTLMGVFKSKWEKQPFIFEIYRGKQVFVDMQVTPEA